MIRLRKNLGMPMLIGLGLCVSVFAEAQIGVDPNWGTAANTFNLNCISADCGGGGVSGGDSGPGSNEDNYQSSPATSTINNSLGATTVTAEFVGAGPGLNTMLFTGDSTSTTLGISDGTSKALGLYTYSGPATNLTITIEIAANATFSGPLSGEDNNIDGIRGRIYVFTNEFAISDINDFEFGANLTCLFECYSPDEDISVEINSGVSNLVNSVTIALDDGDQFYLYGQADIGAAGGGAADAGDGIEVSFSSTSGLTSVPGGSAPVDTDGDGVDDSADNCTLVANADQRDTNSDGYGNLCDPDFDNNGTVNFLDISGWVPLFNTACGDVDEDLTGDGSCNFADFSLIPAYFGGPPGPSGVAP